MKYFIKYLKTINQEHRKTPNQFSKIQTLSYYFKWKNTIKSNGGALADELPWMNFLAIDFLEKIAHKKMKVFEYGSGGSTLFWARRVQEVYSVEHDPTWVKDVAEQLKRKKIQNVQLMQVAPQKENYFQSKIISNPYDYISDDYSFHGYHFEEYVKTIDQYPDNYFDVVVVDGRARPSCLLNARRKVKSNGYLLIDNTERTYYFEKTLPTLLAEKWEQQDFYGPVPYLDHFCQTTVFKKRE